MSLLVTGSIGFDDVQTPCGEVKEAYGGSAVHFAFAAVLYTPVRLVGVVGEDFPPDFHAYLQRRDIDLAGLEVRPGSRTFRWAGRYDQVTSDAQTVHLELNVLGEAGPRIPPQFADSEFVFLAATHPRLQQDLIGQLTSPRLVVCDTRDVWITSQREELLKTLGMVHGVILNDAEARLLTGEHHLVVVARHILKWGPRFVVIKKGEHGVMLTTPNRVAVLPAFPTADVKDPTGAGDSFAGGMMGYLTTQKDVSFGTLKNALARGTVTASFTIEDFGLRAIAKVTLADVDRRFKQYSAMFSL